MRVLERCGVGGEVRLWPMVPDRREGRPSVSQGGAWRSLLGRSPGRMLDLLFELLGGGLDKVSSLF